MGEGREGMEAQFKRAHKKKVAMKEAIFAWPAMHCTQFYGIAYIVRYVYVY